MSVPTQEQSADVAETIAQVRAGIAQLGAVDWASRPAAEQLAALREVEVLGRQHDALVHQIAGAVDRSAAFGVDGHRNAKAAVKYLGRVDGAEADRRVRTARALARLPQFAAAYAAGEIPTGHARVVANVLRNPRVDESVNDSTDTFFTDEARTRSHQSFLRLLQQWERLVDQDGALDRSEHSHARRRASLTHEFDGGYRLEMRGGALQGAIVQQVLAKYEQIEFEADWAQARERYGDDATVEHLERTAGQRRHDAVIAMCRAAAAADPESSVEPEPLVNVVVDQETFERAMAMAAGDDVEPDDPTRAADVRAGTASGIPLTPLDIAECAIVGHVRRVVLGSDSVVIDLGRRQRLFKRGARDAVLLGRWPGQDPGCPYLDCGIPDRWVQIDHVHDWQHGGPTSPWNGAPSCGHHNRLKNAGFIIRYAVDGSAAHLRPDGAPVTLAV